MAHKKIQIIIRFAYRTWHVYSMDLICFICNFNFNIKVLIKNNRIICMRERETERERKRDCILKLNLYSKFDY